MARSGTSVTISRVGAGRSGMPHSTRPRPGQASAVDLTRAPVDGAEASLAEEVVGEGDRLHGLVAVATGVDAHDPVVPALSLQHDEIADDQSQAENRMRNHTIAVVALLTIADRSGGAEAGAAEDSALQGHRAGQPPLSDGSERQVG